MTNQPVIVTLIPLGLLPTEIRQLRIQKQSIVSKRQLIIDCFLFDTATSQVGEFGA